MIILPGFYLKKQYNFKIYKKNREQRWEKGDFRQKLLFLRKRTGYRRVYTRVRKDEFDRRHIDKAEYIDKKFQKLHHFFRRKRKYSHLKNRIRMYWYSLSFLVHGEDIFNSISSVVGDPKGDNGLRYYFRVRKGKYGGIFVRFAKWYGIRSRKKGKYHKGIKERYTDVNYKQSTHSVKLRKFYKFLIIKYLSRQLKLKNFSKLIVRPYSRFLELMESKLDRFVYKTDVVPHYEKARYVINGGKVIVNGKVNRNKNYILKNFSTIRLTVPADHIGHRIDPYIQYKNVEQFDFENDEEKHISFGHDYVGNRHLSIGVKIPDMGLSNDGRWNDHASSLLNYYHYRIIAYL